jgi:hypothetical protein
VNPDDCIDPVLVESVLINAFPGTDILKSSAVGRRRVFIAEFSEFKLTVTTPETSGMRKPTTVAFRRSIEFQQGAGGSRTVKVFNLNKSFKHDDPDGFMQEVRRARAYCMGIVMALSEAFNDPYSDEGV